MASFHSAAADATDKIRAVSYDGNQKGNAAIAAAILTHAHAMEDIAEAIRSATGR